MAVKRNPTTGKIIAKRFSMARIEEANENMEGLCLACGASKSGCEPDARRYRCEGCGMDTVFGAEEVALMGLVKGSARASAE